MRIDHLVKKHFTQEERDIIEIVLTETSHQAKHPECYNKILDKKERGSMFDIHHYHLDPKEGVDIPERNEKKIMPNETNGDHKSEDFKTKGTPSFDKSKKEAAKESNTEKPPEPGIRPIAIPF